MKNLMQILMLDCNEATRLTSIKRYQKLTLKQRMQLSVHLMVCQVCKKFSIFSDLVDESMEHVCQAPKEKEYHISDDKKNELESLIKKEIEP